MLIFFEKNLQKIEKKFQKTIDKRNDICYTYIRKKRKGVIKMTTIKVKTKADFEATKKQYRDRGYNFITFTKRLVEMENMNGDMVMIEY